MTGLGHLRNGVVAATGDAVIAVGGSHGTLTEIGFARIFGRPVVILEPGLDVEGVPRATTPAGAVDLVLWSVA
jgi:predicted Rossmann-fold nucleotide-binding protein